MTLEEAYDKLEILFIYAPEKRTFSFEKVPVLAAIYRTACNLILGDGSALYHEGTYQTPFGDITFTGEPSNTKTTDSD